MVALPFAQGQVKIRLIGTTQNRPVVHVMHGTGTPSPMSAADLNAIATGVRNAWNTNFASLFNTATNYTIFEVTDLGSQTGLVEQNTTVVTGTKGAAANLSVATAVVISWKTAYHYRGGHARTYLPMGLASDILAGNQLLGTTQTATSTAATAFLVALNAITLSTGQFVFAALSYHTKLAVRPTPLPMPITGAVVHNRIDSQRRRLGKEF